MQSCFTYQPMLRHVVKSYGPSYGLISLRNDYALLKLEITESDILSHAHLHPGYFFGHVNGILKIYIRGEGGGGRYGNHYYESSCVK